MTLPTIVVGVDGSPASHAALRVAIDEAAFRRGRVMVIACWSAADHHLFRPAPHEENDSFWTAQAIVQEAVDAIAADPRERSMIVIESGEGDPGPTLVEASRRADLLVIGSTSRSATARLLGRTTVDHCLHHGVVPLLVVPFVSQPLEDADVEIELRHAADPPVDLPEADQALAWLDRP